MGFLQGLITTELTAAGDSVVTRFTQLRDEDVWYAIDSPTVENLRVFRDGEELTPMVQQTADRTAVQFTHDAPAWVGMTYTRRGFVTQADRTWTYRDRWTLQQPVLFILVLPPHAVITDTEPTSPQVERFLDSRYLAGDRVVLTARVMDASFNLELQYRIDPDVHTTLDHPELAPETIPETGEFEFQAYDDTEAESSALQTHRMLWGAREGLDMAGRAITVQTILDIAGLAPA